VGFISIPFGSIFVVALFRQQDQACRELIFEKKGAARMIRPPNTSEQTRPGSFCKLLDGLIPSAFKPWFEGLWPETIKLKISTDCIWEVGLKEEDGKIVMDARWSAFVKAHDLKIGYFTVFKRIDTRSLKVLVFDHENCEKVIKCKGNHAPLEEQYGSQLK
jgi:hypothetical protein